MRLFLYMFYASVGTLWTSFGGVRLFQPMAVLLIVLTALLARRTLIANVKRHAFIATSFLIWGIILETSILFGDTYWSHADVLKFLVYALTALSLGVWFTKIEDFNFTLAAWIFIATFLATLVQISSHSILSFILEVAQAISSGQPNALIFGIFGNKSALVAEDASYTAGLRHTISIVFVVIIFQNLLQMKRNGFSIAAISAIGFLAFLLIALQSRSAWVAFAAGLFILGAQSLNKAKITPFKLFMMIPVTAALYISALKVYDLILKRFENTQSLEGRADYLKTHLAQVWQNGLDATNAAFVPDSSHNFIVDSGVSGGIAGMFAAAICFFAMTHAVMRAGLSKQGAFAAAAGTTLLVRLLTAGNGLPGIGGFMGFAMIIAWAGVHEPKRNQVIAPARPS